MISLKNLKKQVDNGLWAVRLPVQTSELLVRGTEYANLRHMGWTQAAAMEQTGRVSTSFHHVGRWFHKPGGWRIYRRSIAYISPAWQAFLMYNNTLGTPLGKKMAKEERNRTWKRLAILGSVLSAAYLANMLATIHSTEKQKKKYKRIFTKDLAKNAYIPSPDGENFIRLRMNEGYTLPLNIVNNIVMDKMLNTHYNGYEKYVDPMTALLPQQLNPVDALRIAFNYIIPMADTVQSRVIKDENSATTGAFGVSQVPQVVKPWIENAYGIKSYPSIRPMIPRTVEGLDYKDQKLPWTSPVAIWIGKELDVSPIKVDNIWEGYVGRAGGLISGRVDPLSIKNVYVKNLQMLQSRRMNEYYAYKNVIDRIHASAEKAEKKDGVNPYSSYSKEILEEVYAKYDMIKETDKMISDLHDISNQYRDVPADQVPEKVKDAVWKLEEATDKMIDMITSPMDELKKASNVGSK